MRTKVRRIDLATVDDLGAAIATLSDNMLAGGFRLSSTFVYERQLVLIYQKLD
jgi:hypothetical protein